MSIVPTISAYAPFHQSSAGYGMLVGGTMPGQYDIGATHPDVLEVSFATDHRSDLGVAFFFGDHRDLHRVDRRQRQMCIRDRTYAKVDDAGLLAEMEASEWVGVDVELSTEGGRNTVLV